MQSHDRNPVSCRFPPFLTALISCVVFLTSAVTADSLLSPVSFPSNVTLCEPVNFTCTGGTPPYWLYIYGDLGNSKLLVQNTSGILTTWFVWIPDIPAVPRSLLRVRLGDSMTQTGFFSPMLVGSEKSSCLGSATPPAAIPQASSMPGPATPSESQPSTLENATAPSSGLEPTTSQSASIPTTSSTDRLNAAVRVAAGVAVAATVVSLGLVLVLVLMARRVLARRKNHARHGVQPLAGAHDRDTAASSLTSPTSQTSAPGALAGGAVHIDPYLHPYPYPYPAPPAMRECLASGPELDLEANEPVAVGVQTPLARAGTGGYSVMADVGGAGGALGRPISLSRVTDPDRPLGPVGNRDFRPSVGEVFRGVRRHHWLQRKRPCVPVEPRLHDRAGLHPCQELGGVPPPAVFGSERCTSTRLGREREATESDARPIGRAEADGWDIRSLSEGTTLPPYVP